MKLNVLLFSIVASCLAPSSELDKHASFYIPGRFVLEEPDGDPQDPQDPQDVEMEELGNYKLPHKNLLAKIRQETSIVDDFDTKLDTYYKSLIGIFQLLGHRTRDNSLCASSA